MIAGADTLTAVSWDSEQETPAELFLNFWPKETVSNKAVLF